MTNKTLGNRRESNACLVWLGNHEGHMKRPGAVGAAPAVTGTVIPLAGGPSVSTLPDQSEPTSLYRYYDRFDTLIYVGITGRGIRRNREHSRRAKWWPFVARQTVEHLATREEALKREAQLIANTSPPFNRQHNTAPSSDAYIRWMKSVDPESTLESVVERLGRRMPLSVVKQSVGKISLATDPAHVAATRFLYPTTTACFTDENGRGFGRASIFYKRGFVSIIAGDVTGLSYKVGSAIARVSIPNQKPGQVDITPRLIIRGIRLKAAE